MTPFLEAHRVFSRFYLLSPGPSPISIRDQMLRGRLIVEELIHKEIINKDKPLLVVGGGAGGVTAAMFGAEQRIRTTLVERKRACFSVQKLSSRFIHPNQYDWPVDHYTRKDVLFHTLLPFEANKAEELANRWELELGMFAKTNIYYQFMPNTEITNIQVISDTLGNDLSLQVTFNNAEVYNFSAVIWATGAGSEDCQFRDSDDTPVYEGIKFWDNDQFESDHCGLTDTPRIVISGSGDGALQDFLRCVTRINSAIKIYEQLFDSILATTRTNIEAVLQSAEDRARRCLIWASTREQEDCIYQELEDTHKDQISYLLHNSNIGDKLDDLLKVWLNEKAKISLVFRQNYFKNYYPLNRFLVLLIAQYLHRQGQNILYRNSKIISIEPNGHECMEYSRGTWMPTEEDDGTRSCHGGEHTVGIGVGDFEYFFYFLAIAKLLYDQYFRLLDFYFHTLIQQHRDVNNETRTELTELTANIIIIRHGLNTDSIYSVLEQQKDRCVEIIRKKHLMPYHWPCP